VGVRRRGRSATSNPASFYGLDGAKVRQSFVGEPFGKDTLLWTPPADLKEAANITFYLRWLERTRKLQFRSYRELWHWSVTDVEGFWASIWEFFEVIGRRPYKQVLSDRHMPGGRWFTGAELNYAEHALRRRDEHLAVVFRSESGKSVEITYAELYEQVARAAAGLRALGVERGDRVAAYMPNIPEALVGFLAAASIGAVWSSCSPDFGFRAVVDRFRQIEPAVLLAVDGYRYNGRSFDRLPELAEIQKALPSLRAIVLVPYLELPTDKKGLRDTVAWKDVLARADELVFEPVAFDHPLWVLYSSGTTGLPKGIVHGHGGILLEHLKSLSLHLDLKAEDRFFWFTTTGWMMWNFLASGLLLGSTVVMYDGSPSHPATDSLWRMASETITTYFGTSASYLEFCMKAHISPGRTFDLTHLRALGSTGGPLTPEGFKWAYAEVKPNVWLGSVSGGTDVCTAFVGSCPLIPVYAGEIQCAHLGAKVEAYDEAGRSLVEEVGELVITEPMPSMPVSFWNDSDGRRYKESYFDMYPGVWRHGDWVKVTERGGYVIYGRSDATLKRGGIRMGTSEFYRVLAGVPEVLDSIVIDLAGRPPMDRLILFVVLAEGISFDQRLKARINNELRTQLSPRHVPDEIYTIPEVPRTLNGKKLEVPIKRILTGTPLEEAVSQGAVANPDSLRFVLNLVPSVRGRG